MIENTFILCHDIVKVRCENLNVSAVYSTSVAEPEQVFAFLPET